MLRPAVVVVYVVALACSGAAHAGGVAAGVVHRALLERRMAVDRRWFGVSAQRLRSRPRVAVNVVVEREGGPVTRVTVLENTARSPGDP